MESRTKLLRITTEEGETLNVSITFNQVLNQFKGLVYKVVHSIQSNIEEEDLIQVGYMGLYKAYKMYKLDMGTKFITLAQRCIYTSICNYNKTYRKKIETLSLDFNLLEDNENLTAINLVRDNFDMDNTRLILEDTFNNLGEYCRLSRKELEVLKLLCIDDMRVIDIANMKHVSKGAPQNAKRNSINKIKLKFQTRQELAEFLQH